MRSPLRPDPSYTALAALLFLMAGILCGGTLEAQTPDATAGDGTGESQPSAPGDTGPAIIVPPVAPQNSMLKMAGSESTGKSQSQRLDDGLGLSLQALQTNLSDLAALNTQQNQEALNALGRNYGNVTLGMDLSSAVSGLDIDGIKKSSASLIGSMEEQANVVDSSARDFSSHFDTSAITKLAQDPSLMDKMKQDPEGTKKLLQDASRQMHVTGFSPDQTKDIIQIQSMQYMGVMKLTSSIDTLNANVESLRKTYDNLLRLSSAPPTTLLGMKDLGNTLTSVDSLTRTDLASLSSLSGSLQKISGSYNSLNQHKDDGGIYNPNGEVINTFKGISASMDMLSNKITSTNMQMRLILGSPPPPGNTASGTPAPYTPPASSPSAPTAPTQ